MKVDIEIYWDQPSRVWRAHAEFDDTDVFGLRVTRTAASFWRWRVKKKINRKVLDYALDRKEAREKAQLNESYGVEI